MEWRELARLVAARWALCAFEYVERDEGAGEPVILGDWWHRAVCIELVCIELVCMELGGRASAG